MSYHAHAFIDGGHVEQVVTSGKQWMPSPADYARTALEASCSRIGVEHVILRRTTYYDACPEDAAGVSDARRDFWNTIEEQPDTSLGFGYLRGRRAGEPRQKAVDTLIAVDMLVGAFTQLFDVALLITADADFIPVIEEVRRRGVLVVLHGDPQTTSPILRRAADRFTPFVPGHYGPFLPLRGSGQWGNGWLPSDLRGSAPLVK